MNIIFVLLIVFFLGAGIRFLFLHLKPLLSYTKAKRWDVVPGKVTQVFSNGSWLDLNEAMNVTDSFMLKYEYSHKGKSYTSSNISFERGDTGIINSGKGLGSEFKVVINSGEVLKGLVNSGKGFTVSHSSSFMKNLKRNRNVNVWVNPLHAEDSTLVINQAYHLKRTLFGVTLIIWSLGFIAMSISFNSSEPVEKEIIVIETKSPEETNGIDD